MKKPGPQARFGGPEGPRQLAPQLRSRRGARVPEVLPFMLPLSLPMPVDEPVDEPVVEPDDEPLDDGSLDVLPLPIEPLLVVPPIELPLLPVGLDERLAPVVPVVPDGALVRSVEFSAPAGVDEFGPVLVLPCVLGLGAEPVLPLVEPALPLLLPVPVVVPDELPAPVALVPLLLSRPPALPWACAMPATPTMAAAAAALKSFSFNMVHISCWAPKGPGVCSVLRKMSKDRNEFSARGVPGTCGG